MDVWEIVLWAGIFSWGVGSLCLFVVNMKNFRLVDFSLARYRNAKPQDKKILMLSGALFIAGSILMISSLVIKGVFYK